ncbi:MAG TPA: hypothetical protein VNB49_10920 [Candidatus Dormibacteraeota bacterium]|nr:hypothetical protein [Candidatus Dormibacteraeota bacterium]
MQLRSYGVGLLLGLGGFVYSLLEQREFGVASLFRLFCNGVHVVGCGIGGMRFKRVTAAAVFFTAVLGTICAVRAAQKALWRSVEFAIVKFNDEAPKSWGMYHTEKKGLLLVRIWKRYLLVNVKNEEVYEIDPQTVKPVGDNVEWSLADKPSEPLETPEWKTRDIGPMQQVAFRLGKGGSVLQLQIPLKPNGQPMY